MPKQTRKAKKLQKRRKQKGGAVSHLPRVIFPTTGKAQLELITDFFTRAHIYYVSAHGALHSRKTYEVPPNTYILHVGVSGKVCDTSNIMNEFLLAEGFPLNKKKEMLWKFLTGQRLGPALNNILFKPDRFNQRTNTIAIYEPGDIVHDMTFSFENTNADSGYIQLGAFKFPFAEDLMEQAEKIAVEREGEYMKKAMRLGGINSPAFRAQRKKLAKDFAMKHDNLLRYRGDNKLRRLFSEIEAAAEEESEEDEKRYTMLESEFVELQDFFVPANDHYRVFIVFSCRGVYDVLPEEEAEAGRRTRRASLNLRSYANRARPTLRGNENRLMNEALLEVGIGRRENIRAGPIVPVLPPSTAPGAARAAVAEAAPVAAAANGV
jgi:hypothetical protein